MNITSGEIIQYNNDLWVSQDYIINSGIDANYLRVAKHRANNGDGQSWQNKTIAKRCYFLYSALPRTATTKMDDPGTLAKRAVEVRDDIANLVSRAIYSTFKLYLKDMNKDEACAAAILHEASIYIQTNKISFSKSAFFDDLANEIKRQEIKYLPVTWRNLRDKIKCHIDGKKITEIIRAKNIGNTNRAEFKNNDFIKGTLVELASSQKNYSAAFIYRKIRLLCQQNGLDKSPSERWVSDAIKAPEMKFLIQQRYGANTRHNAHYRGYTPMQSALFAGDAWQVDGTRVNIVDHRATWTDEKGKRHTGQKYLYIVAVRDVMSGLPLGWEYCYDESAQAVIGALSMAVRNSGYLPYEFIYDRFPGHNSDEWQWIESQMHLKGVIMTKTHKAEGKGNIERWFGTLQSVFMSESDLYYGEGIRSTRRYAHRSKEYVTEMRMWAAKNNFNFDAAIRETDKILENYINTPYNAYSRKFRHIDKSPLELHDESDKPNTMPVDQAEYCFLFGLRKQVSIRNYMIQTQIEGAPYYYGIDDVDITEKYTGVKLWNCFDYEDLSTVHLFDGNTYLGSFNEVPPAQRFGPNKDMRAVGITKKISEKNDQRRKQRLQEIERRKIAATGVSDEEDMISPEVGIMQGGNIAKKLYEAAETAFLNKEWATDEEDEPVHVNARNQY